MDVAAPHLGNQVFSVLLAGSLAACSSLAVGPIESAPPRSHASPPPASGSSAPSLATSTRETGQATALSPTHIPQPLLQITYIAERAPEVYGLFAITLECPTGSPPCPSAPQLLFDIPGPLDYASDFFSWSPEGMQLAFVSPGQAGWLDVFVSDSDGDNIVNITQSPLEERFPAWSPDGRRIAYVLYTTHGSVLLWSNREGTDGGEPLRLTDINDPDTPAWSPDGRLITFTDVYPWVSGTSQVFAGDTIQQTLVQLTSADRNSYTSAFSPDGSTIVFARDVMDATVYGGQDDQNIFVTRLDGSGEHWLIGERGARCSHPEWSPWGDWIAFHYERYGEVSDIYLVRPDGTQLVNLTNSPAANEWGPKWRGLLVP